MPAPMSAAEKARFDRPPQRLLDKLRPYQPRLHKGVKPEHARVFASVAASLKLALLLRATNEASLPYMGVPGYSAKPIDCKPKTCDRNVAIGQQPVDCAGLVADPTIVGRQAYGSDKLKEAIETWQGFELSMHRRSMGNGVTLYERADHKGFYAVDIAPPGTLHRHHGCLLVSDHAPPSDFDPRKSHIRTWIGRHMSYVHGDYDLYGVLDGNAAAEAGDDKLQQVDVRNQPLLGQKHFVTALSQKAAQALNAGLGTELVKHGEQSAWKFKQEADDVFIFFPNGEVMVALAEAFKQPEREMAAWFEDLYRYVFKTAYDGRERVSERALR